MACVGWALRGHAAPGWTRPGECIHSSQDEDLLHKCLVCASHWAMSAPRALASGLAVVLEHMDLNNVGDLADFLAADFANGQLLASRIRDEFVAVAREAVATDVLSVARASAERLLLDRELRALEASEATLQLHAARDAIGSGRLYLQ